MRIVSPFLRKALYPAMSAAGLFRRAPAGGLAVITYHGVLPREYKQVDPGLDGNLIGAETLRRQLRLLKAHYRVVCPEDVLAWREGQCQLPSRAVLLTCDDGLLNCFTEMLPVLHEEKLHCLFFVTGASAEEKRATLWYEELLLLFLRASGGRFQISSEGMDFCGELGSREQRRSLWWSSVKRLSQISAAKRVLFLRALRRQFKVEARPGLGSEDSAVARRFGLMTVSELQQLASAGMSIGAHTQSHPMLSQAPAEIVRNEVSGCKQRLESALGRPVWALAYPFGNPESVTPQVLDIAQSAGFKAAFVNYGGGLGVDLPAYALPRIHVASKMSLAEFEAQVSGFHTRWQRRAGRKSPKLETAQS